MLSCCRSSPQQWIGLPLGPIRRGWRAGGSVELWGMRLKVAPVSTRKRLPVSWHCTCTSIPAATGLSRAGTVSFPASCRAANTCGPWARSCSGTNRGPCPSRVLGRRPRRRITLRLGEEGVAATQQLLLPCLPLPIPSLPARKLSPRLNFQLSTRAF